PEILKALSLGKKIYGEIEAAFWFCPCPIIAFTGTNGKTTTTELTGEIFRNAGFDTKVCGNVGVAFSEVIDSLKINSVVVLEVSSFQLDSIESFRPKVSAILNLTPDHLEWHKNIENYIGAKLKINSNQKEDDNIIINYDDPVLTIVKNKLNAGISAFSATQNLIDENLSNGAFVENGEIIYFDSKNGLKENIIDIKDIYIKGNHNVQNSLAAIIAAKAFGIHKEIIRKSLIEFKGVEHRIEFVRELKGVKFYNDSKATNIDSMTVAVESFPENIILILGGKKMENDFSKVKGLIKSRVKVIIAVGDSKYDVEKQFSPDVKVFIADTFDNAVKSAFSSSQTGDVVLFSPAYKSFDLFDNFEHRGKEFKRIVNNL
ncbi:MAG TPA: UDP-N-acetylmuramoyl-L-alanine--D-glutamate ligase, partial [Ignavibacteria bacterium]